LPVTATCGPDRVSFGPFRGFPTSIVSLDCAVIGRSFAALLAAAAAAAACAVETLKSLSIIFYVKVGAAFQFGAIGRHRSNCVHDPLHFAD